MSGAVTHVTCADGEVDVMDYGGFNQLVDIYRLYANVAFVDNS
jgi:hypothetical protein